MRLRWKGPKGGGLTDPSNGPPSAAMMQRSVRRDAGGSLPSTPRINEDASCAALCKAAPRGAASSSSSSPSLPNSNSSSSDAEAPSLSGSRSPSGSASGHEETLICPTPESRG